MPYPVNKVNTTGAVIPYVETCHCGPIPTTAVTKCLLVCSADCSHFYILRNLADPRLSDVEAEFQKVIPAGTEERARMMQQIAKRTKSPEFQAQLQRARKAAEAAKKRVEGAAPDHPN